MKCLDVNETKGLSMTKLNRDALESSYSSPAVVRFYTTDWAPNGTSMLIITDDMGQIIGHIDEALFGPVLDSDRCGDMLGDKHVWLDEAICVYDSETASELRCGGDLEVCPLKIDDVLDSIAESPIQSRFSVLRRLVEIIKTERRTLKS